MKLTLRQLKKLIEGVMADDAKFPEKLDIADVMSKEEEARAAAQDIRSISKGSFEAEPKSWEQELDQYIAMLGDPNIPAEDFMYLVQDNPQIFAKIFELDLNTYEVKVYDHIIKSALRLGNINKSDIDRKISEMINIARSELSTSNTFFKKAFNVEKAIGGPVNFENRVRSLFNSNELRVLDNQFRPLIKGRKMICDWNNVADQVCISFPGLSPGDLPDKPFLTTGTEIGRDDQGFLDYNNRTSVPLMDLGGIHFFWFMANQKTEFNKKVAEYDGDIWEAYEDLQDQQRRSDYESYVFEWFPKMATYCCLYANTTQLGVEWMGGHAWHEPGERHNPMGDNYVIETFNNNKPLEIVADMLNSGERNITFSDFPNYNQQEDRLEIFDQRDAEERAQQRAEENRGYGIY